MPLLHTVNRGPFERNMLESCIRSANADSSVLLTVDSVIAAMQDTKYSSTVTEAMANTTFYVLGPDFKARGLSESNIVEGVKVVDYDGFVDLTVDHESVQSWL